MLDIKKPEEWPTVIKLVKTLERRKDRRLLPLIEEAKTGAFHDYLNQDYAMPLVMLVARLKAIDEKKYRGLCLQIVDGAFDATEEEGAAWFEQEGKTLLPPEMNKALFDYEEPPDA